MTKNVRSGLLVVGLVLTVRLAVASGINFNDTTQQAIYPIASGNVGVGTTTPQAAFTVTSGNVGIGTWTAAGGALIVKGGNVGIGTTTAPQVLYVAGTMEGQGFKLNQNAAAGYILTSTSAGIGTWMPNQASGGGGGGATDINGLSDAVTDYVTDNNLFMGSGAGASIAAGGKYNTLIGESAGNSISTGDYNVALGYEALKSFTTGEYSTAIGYRALSSATGSYNTAVGGYALNANTTGAYNMAIGTLALSLNQDGGQNVAVGMEALRFNTSGTANFGLGWKTLYSNTTGNGQVAIGNNALYAATGGHNIAIGYNTGDAITTGQYNIIIGDDTDAPSATASYQLDIGNTIYGNLSTGNVGIGTSSVQSAFVVTNGNVGIGTWTAAGSLIVMGGNVGIGTVVPAAKLVVNGTLRVPGLTDAINNYYVCFNTATGEMTFQGSCTLSSQRWKEDIIPLADANGLDEIMALKPVTFKYKSGFGDERGGKTGGGDGDHFGFIAEQAAAVDPRLVTLDDKGLPETFNYNNYTAVLTKAIQQQQEQIESVQIEVEGFKKYIASTGPTFKTGGQAIIGVTNVPATIHLSLADRVIGRTISIKDETGHAGTSPITVDDESGELIDGASSVTLTTNYGSLRLYSNGKNWFTLN